MLTVMCPNCRHRFPAGGCCEPGNVASNPITENSPASCYYGGILVPKGYSGGGCFINAPTIIQNPQITLSLNEKPTLDSQILSSHNHSRLEKRSEAFRSEKSCRNHLDLIPSRFQDIEVNKTPSECHITTTCNLTGGSVIITTPSIQSGGCLIQTGDSTMLIQGPQEEFKSKLSGGGCFLQKISMESQDSGMALDPRENKLEDDLMDCLMNGSDERMVLAPPSGCQELPGTRRSLGSHIPDKRDVAKEVPVFSSFQISGLNVPQQIRGNEETRESFRNISSGCCSSRQSFCRSKPSPISIPENRESVVIDPSSGLQLQVNATVQLPASFGQCTVNITATTANTQAGVFNNPASRSRDNFHGGGLIQENEAVINHSNEEEENIEERRSPTTPVSWLMRCPFGIDTFLIDKDIAKMNEVKRCLQICGWYHEGLSWQQSENLLKNSKVGRWLMRDSSDSRFTFAVSVQTARGPTSVRVHYFLGRFRLDAEPRLACALPLFDCPIKMLQYYVEYSKSVDKHRKEVWVDYSGQLYSEIYLTKPLLKEVRSLSHLSRLVVNRHKLRTDHLPPVIRNYLAEYPYTL